MKSVAVHLLAFVALVSSVPLWAQDDHHSLSPKILAAKSIYFADVTGNSKVGDKALERLKKWGRFPIVMNKDQADLIIVLSDEPNGAIVFSGGQTGTIDSGHIDEDTVPAYRKAAPVRYAYLTVVDRKTGDVLWKDAHRWGGLLTGFNSAGENLIKDFQKQFK